ncbi:PKD domain-containing protein [Actinomadura sp. DC4]|uniref:PKD domain-containing protein n=1 Tax=Actinomadura sp. DC4 TaxID=3055069 RepID=UPI0025AF56BB|nr:PKD domain-containing protein [Actinomadura sp. DC4]MDN3352514.1 PKD domain-containing protein [Actinomadura sp. DC4]
MRLRSLIVSGAALLLTAGLVTTTAGTSARADPPQTGIVNADPAGFTPDLVDGDVQSVVQIGDRIFLGGNFTQVKEAGSSTVITRNRVLAFNATTGKIDENFHPSADGEVSVLLPAADGHSIYLGGLFTHIDGVAHKVLARLDVDTGQPVAGFTPNVDARVKDLRLAGGRLWVGGNFDLVDGVAQNALATLNPDTGRRDAFQSLPFAGTQNDGTTLVYKMDVTPDGSKLVAVGNFTSVGGQSRPQIVMLDLTGTSASLADWQTSRYAAQCSASFDSYMRDVDMSPDGSFFVVSTTGAAGGTSKMCDSQSRWETSATGSSLSPTWITYTGGDTTYAVEVTGSAVYIGGHFRWSNNPFGSDAPGQGAVERSGIAALDPASGMPFQWNPGRTRGVGVFDLLATQQGLWMASDTDETGGETHQKIALFPTSGGETLPAQYTGTLPGDVYSGGTATVNQLQHRSFDGTTAGSVTSDGTGGIDWRTIRGAFMINDRLYTGTSDGSLNRRTFDGSTFGSPSVVNGADALVSETDWHNQVKSIKGMFYANGRIYYTRGTSALYYRGFNPESDVVGALETSATGNLPGVDWSTVGGMFTAGGKLYYVSTADGKLRSLDFTGGVPSGTPAVVDSGDWRGQGVFLYAGVPNSPPTAAFTSNCDHLACAFDGTGSSDSDGTIASYAWDFGDGATGTGATPQHTYTGAGTYTAKLTVTDNRGGTATVSQQVHPAAANIAYVGTDVYNGNTTNATVTVPASVQAGDGLLLEFTDNDTTRTVTPPSGWQQVGTQTSGTAVSTIWQRVATTGDAGHTVSVGLSDYAKANLRVLAYQGTSATAPVAVAAKTTDAATSTSHTSPTATVTAAGSWAVTYWSDKSSTTGAWTAPAGVTSRGSSVGSGSGRVTSLTADSGGTVPTGTYGGLTATTDAASKALTWTIVLAPTS